MRYFGSQNAPTGGEELARHESTAAPADYFGQQDRVSTLPVVPQSPQQVDNGSQHPWAHLFQQSGPHTGEPLAASSSQQANASLHVPTSLADLKLSSHMRLSRGVSNGTSSVAMSMSSSDSSKYTPIKPPDLMTMLLQEYDQESFETLIIDIRPSTSFALARIRNSVNVCAPSTLLRRAGVTVERIEEEMLSSDSDQKKFSTWRNGPFRSEFSKQGSRLDRESQAQRIVVLDTDTRNISEVGKSCTGGGGPCLTGLLRKFDLAGYAGQMYWLVGGFNAFASKVASSIRNEPLSEAMNQLVDRSTLKQHESIPSKDQTSALKRIDSQRRASAPNFQDVRGNDLTNSVSQAPRKHSLVQPKGLPLEAFSSSSTASHARAKLSDREADEQGNLIGSNSNFQAANPFFDNIRQNRELQHGITENIPLSLPSMSEEELSFFPEELRRMFLMTESKRASEVAKGFFSIEVAERDRLMATMQHHSKDSNNTAQDPAQTSLQLSSEYSSISSNKNPADGHGKAFPFSISAAIERGSENRYNNIWTYEHSRVHCVDSNAFFNGSFIEPGRQFDCHRKYIATQAPLPSTFNTFWSVVWDQNIHTICMLTREFESGRVQSHNYWNATTYGSLELELVSEIKMNRHGQAIELPQQSTDESSGYFGDESNTQNDEQCTTIRRQFWLKDQSGKRRLITQLQYIAWPDYSVPDNAEDLLSFIRMANQNQHQHDLEMQASEGQEVGPLLVHCSAGVGRTGTYVLIDCVLDIIRRARTAEQSRLAVWDDGFAMNERGTRGRCTSSASSNEQPVSSPPNSGQQRKNLKRELSPGPMYLDRSEESITVSSRDQERGRPDLDSPPPARRSRSDDDSEDDATSHRVSSSGPSKSQLSFGAFATDAPATPSTALGKLSLGTSLHASNRERGEKFLQENISTPKASSENTSEQYFGPRSPTRSVIGSNLVFSVLQIIREQRMSMVQTARQYVFAYFAIFVGVLLEIRKNREALPPLTT